MAKSTFSDARTVMANVESNHESKSLIAARITYV